MKETYTFYSDAGHGWLKVSIEEVKELNVKVSKYSYRKNHTLYLEEDCDAPKFLEAYESKFGFRPNIKEAPSVNQSFIRGLQEPIPIELLN